MSWEDGGHTRSASNRRWGDMLLGDWIVYRFGSPLLIEPWLPIAVEEVFLVVPLRVV